MLPVLLLALVPLVQTQPAKAASNKVHKPAHTAHLTGKTPYRRATALRSVKVSSRSLASRSSKLTARRSVVNSAVSAELRAAAFSVVSQRMETAPNHFEELGQLHPFFDRLNQGIRDGQPVHILQFGDSHTASDDWVRAMREAFQGRYGFGGAGFATAGHIKGYRRYDVQTETSVGWQVQGLVGHPADPFQGLSGLSLTASSPDETTKLTTYGDQLELFYLRQPNGGSFTIEVDGSPIETVNTTGVQETGFYTYQPTPGEHTYTVRTLSANPVRLYGWVSQNFRGVTWETLGINGAQVGGILNWDQALWTQQIQRRDPALVIIAYGTNEALSPSWTPDDYRANLHQVIERFRSAVPNAALLLVGPPDCGRLHPFPHLQEVIQIQRQIAEQTGIAFWDWRHHMGGPGATHMWVRAGLSQPDYVHLTGDGYRLLGRTLAQELDLEYRRYQAQPMASLPVSRASFTRPSSSVSPISN